MAYPAGVKTTQLRIGGKSVSGLGVPASVRVFVRPTHFLVWAADGSPVIPLQESLPKAETVIVQLPQVDQTGFLDQSGRPFTLWAYTITVYYRAKGTTTDYVVSKDVQPLLGQETIDFELVLSGEASASVTGDLALVTSVNGMTGTVLIEAATGGVTSYNDLTDKPTIPSVSSDIGAQPAGDYVLSTDARLTDARPPTAHSQAISTITGLQLALDAKQASGSYVVGSDARLSDARTPKAHTHTFSDVPGLQAALDSAGGSPTWDSVQDKPTAFAPSAHTHTIGNVTGLQAALDSKGTSSLTLGTTSITAKAGNYTPTIAGVTGLTAALDGKQAVGSYALTSDARLSDARTPLAHTHSFSDTPGLQLALDSKGTSNLALGTTASTAKAGDYTPSVADVTGLTSALADKQATGSYVVTSDSRLTDARTPLAHSHVVADVTSLQSALDGKQASGDYATNTALAGKANTSHTHTIANVTGLQTALDSKGTSNLAIGTTGSTAKAGDYKPPYSDLPPGSMSVVRRVGGVWPPRPSVDPGVTFVWAGAAPSPPIVESGTGGMLNNVDFRWVIV